MLQMDGKPGPVHLLAIKLQLYYHSAKMRLIVSVPPDSKCMGLIIRRGLRIIYEGNLSATHQAHRVHQSISYGTQFSHEWHQTMQMKHENMRENTFMFPADEFYAIISGRCRYSSTMLGKKLRPQLQAITQGTCNGIKIDRIRRYQIAEAMRPFIQ